MAAFVKLAALLFGRLSFCALMGALIGTLAGFLFSALMERSTRGTSSLRRTCCR